MVKFMILFRQPEDIDKFENVYQNFLALVERMPHIQRRQVVHVTGSPLGAPEFYRILELYFKTSEVQRDALMSPEGQEAGGELNRFESGSFELLFADVYEEAGSSTPLPDDAEGAEAKATAAEAAKADAPEGAQETAPEAEATETETQAAEAKQQSSDAVAASSAD